LTIFLKALGDKEESWKESLCLSRNHVKSCSRSPVVNITYSPLPRIPEYVGQLLDQLYGPAVEMGIQVLDMTVQEGGVETLPVHLKFLVGKHSLLQIKTYLCTSPSAIRRPFLVNGSTLCFAMGFPEAYGYDTNTSFLASGLVRRTLSLPSTPLYLIRPSGVSFC